MPSVEDGTHHRVGLAVGYEPHAQQAGLAVDQRHDPRKPLTHDGVAFPVTHPLAALHDSRPLGDAPRDVGLGDLMIVLRAGSTRVELHAEHARGVATVTVSAIQPATAVLASADHSAGVVMIEDKIVLLPDVASFLAAARNVELREATAA